MSRRDGAGVFRVSNAVKLTDRPRPTPMSKITKGSSQRPRNPPPEITRVILHPNVVSVNDVYGTNRMIRQAERVLQRSFKLQPKTDFTKKVEASHQFLTTHKELIHQSKKDTPKIPQVAAEWLKEFDPKLDDLQYEPLKGIGQHDPLKLLEMVRTKRDDALKSGGKPPPERQDESLGADWNRVITMDSSVLDEALRDTPPSRPPTLTAMAKAKEGDDKDSQPKREASPASTKAKPDAKMTSVKPGKPGASKKEDDLLRKQHAFKDGEDYFFRAHPPFIQMVETVDDEPEGHPHTPSTATPAAAGRKSQVLDVSTYTKKMEIKTAPSSHAKEKASMAEVLFKPAGAGHQFLESGPKSRTPSVMLELEKQIKGKAQRRRIDEARSRPGNYGAAAHTTSIRNPQSESGTDRQRRIKAEKGDQVMQYLRNRPDNIRLFSSAAAEGRISQYSPARGRMTATS